MSNEATTIVRELQFAERARLDFRGDLVAVTVLPLSAGATPRLIVDGPDDGAELDVEVGQRGSWSLASVRHRDALR